MRTPKNQIALAQLKFSYQHYAQFLNLKATANTSNFLLQLWKEDNGAIQPKWYVLFADADGQLITWHCLQNTININECVRNIVGLAKTCNATRLVLAHHRLFNHKPNQTDQLWLSKTFEACERSCLDIIDFLILTPKNYYSFREERLGN